MKRSYLWRSFFVLVLVLSSVAASQKRSLRGNMTLVYHELPPEVNSLTQMFQEGKWYGRLRINSFLWDWKKEYADKTRDNWAIGVGGSLIYKSAYFHGIGATIGIYTTQNPWHMPSDDVGFIKAGKDTFSRYKVKTTGRFGLTSVAQAYVEYRLGQSSFKVGRQIFESLLTKSNDTKMIPNTFRGYSFISRDLAKTTVKLAYFTGQKLRDHETFHDVLTFKDANGESWANNDDSAVNKGLSYQNFVAAGKDPHHDLIVVEVLNKSVAHLRWLLNYTCVPGVVGLGSVEMHYRFDLGEHFTITPGIRYIKQWDLGAKDIGALGVAVANLKADPRGYDDPYTVDSWLVAARIDLRPKSSFWWMRFGYSQVADRADIIAPWRGFPTGGFTRAMAQYNWYANTKSYMVRGVLDLDRLGMVEGLRASLRVAVQDFDDKKSGVQADSNVIHLDLNQKIKFIDGLYMKFRLGIVDGSSNTRDIAGNLKPDPSYNEYRFELNYLF